VSITALDQDPRSLGLVAEQYRCHGVSTLPASVRDLLRQSVDCSDVDLAYAAGLYDYLPDDVGQKLTSALFRMLRSGGRLLIANFTPATDDAAYMEAVMDWRLIYRSEENVRALAAALPPQEVDAIQQFFDSNGHITYMRVTKR
jgi:SAM-dependent methyltransferase